ncbi:50S ribosomal protein L29 [Candidatus Woesearchaeota archaeon]|nr:50S ribosomal protein L29 [Candidatus Woesearchaeota archaeon]
MKLKNKELKAMPEAELRAKLEELRLELMKLNTQAATGTVAKNPSQIKGTKKSIARMLQQLHARKGGTPNV